MPLISGARLGPYQIMEPLGAGGMGEVYRARDIRLGRSVAIKVLPPQHAATPEIRARFEREARTISQLNHPHICVLHDVGRDGDTDYLVMELVGGETLSQRLLKGPLPTAEVLRLGAQIADALDRAHRAGVIHRDLKPGNVMLTKSGVKLMDFGLARAAAPIADASAQAESPTISRSLTAEGTIVGTFQYMAPEQLEGREADARSDIWALGCVLYEMATGARAFEGKSQASLIAAIMEHEPRAMLELQPLAPPALERLVKQCLAKDPDDRWQSAGDIARELQWIAGAASQPGVGGHASAPRRVRRLRAALAGAVLGIVAAASWLAASWWAGRLQSHPSFQALTPRQIPIYRAAFAPDGRTIVFSASPEGNVPRLFVIRPESPEPEPHGDLGTHLLSVSSKSELAVLTGAQFVAHRLFLGTLARMPIAGGAPRAVLDSVREADWSPDGSELAIIRGVAGKDRLEFPAGRVLYESGGYLSDLRFSPSGDRIAFFEHPGSWDDRGSVNLVDLRGRKTMLSDGYWGEEGLAWSPDGREVLFSASKAGSEFAVYAATRAGRTRVALESAGGLTLHDVARYGRWLVSRDDQYWPILVHKPEWAEDRDLTWLGREASGILTRDARRLVFTEQDARMGPFYATCLRGTDGSPVVRLGDGWATAVSPDEKWALSVLFASPPQLRALPLGAGQARVLERGNLENYGYALWFPSGDSVLVYANEPGKAMRHYTQRFGGVPPRPVGPEGTSRGLLSPDGRWILALSGTTWALYPIDGSAPRKVPGLTAQDHVFHWSENGRSVLAQAGLNPPVHAERVNLKTGQRTPWMVIAPRDIVGVRYCNVASVSIDERSYAYNLDRMLSTLFLVTHER